MVSSDKKKKTGNMGMNWRKKGRQREEIRKEKECKCDVEGSDKSVQKPFRQFVQVANILRLALLFENMFYRRTTKATAAGGLKNQRTSNENTSDTSTTPERGEREEKTTEDCKQRLNRGRYKE